MRDDGPGLVADIGATNARFALAWPGGTLDHLRVVLCDDFATIADAISAYLAQQRPQVMPTEAVLAVASPATGDEITLTNHPWTFSIEGLRRHLGLRRLRAINDFSANALAIPRLNEGDCRKVGGGASIAHAPVGVIGPGTGLGVGGLIMSDGQPIPIESEGGHVTMAPADARESAVLDLMRRRYDHVSAERVLSGPGLIGLYNAMCELSGAPTRAITPAQITNSGAWTEDVCAREATAMFCAMLGTVAGNLALTLGARGGIYIAGGIVPRLGPTFEHSVFRARFESKGRLRGYLAAIPTYVVVHPYPALIGAAELLERA